MKIKEWDHLSLTSNISAKLGQIVHVGVVLKSSKQADFITDPGLENCPRFVGVIEIEQNKIQLIYFHYCIYNLQISVTMCYNQNLTQIAKILTIF